MSGQDVVGASRELAEIAAAVEFAPGNGISFRESGAVTLAANIRTLLTAYASMVEEVSLHGALLGEAYRALRAQPAPAAEGVEPCGWQRRMRNTAVADDHPFAQWSSWKECDDEKVAQHNATGGKVSGFPGIETQVRPIYAAPPPSDREDRLREALKAARETLRQQSIGQARQSLILSEMERIDAALDQTTEGGE